MELAELHQKSMGLYTVEFVPQERVILVRHNNDLIGTCLGADELIGTYYESYNDVFYVSFRHGNYIGTRVYAFAVSPAVRELCFELTEAFGLMFSQHETGFRIIAKSQGVYVVSSDSCALLKSVRINKKTSDVVVEDFMDNVFISKFIGHIAHEPVPFMPSELFELPAQAGSGEDNTAFFSQKSVKYSGAFKFAQQHGTPGSNYRVIVVSDSLQVVITDTKKSAVIYNDQILELDDHVSNVWQFQAGDTSYLCIKPVTGATYTLLNLSTLKLGKISQHTFIFMGSDPHDMHFYAFGESVDPIIKVDINQGVDLLTASGTVFNCNGLKGTYTLNKGD